MQVLTILSHLISLKASDKLKDFRTYEFFLAQRGKGRTPSKRFVSIKFKKNKNGDFGLGEGGTGEPGPEPEEGGRGELDRSSWKKYRIFEFSGRS